MSWYHISDSQHTTLQIVAVTHVEVLHAVLWRFPERFLEWFSRCSLSKQLHRIGANPLLTWLFCFQKSTNPGKWSSAFFSRDLRLLGSNIAANRRPRQAAVTTAPAPGPEGNTLPVASLSWQILKTWPSPLAIFVILYLCAILWWCK